MKILVLSNSASKWVKEFVDNVLLPLNHEVFMLSSKKENPYDEFYRKNVVVVAPKSISASVMRIPKFRVVVLLQHQINALRKFRPFDVIINMFVCGSNLYCARMLKDKNTKVIALFCGSDILRIDGYKLAFLKHELNKVDNIYAASEMVKTGIQKKIGKSDVAVIHLGASVFDWIDKIKKNKGKIRDELGIPSTATTICIGYNADEAHQHLRIIQEINKMPDESKQKLFLLIPMTYKREQNYVNRVKSCLKECNLQNYVFETFLDDEHMAQLHCSTDLFINAQITDSLSSSVMESMYSGARVLNAEWLEYPEYKDWGLQYDIFHSISDIPKLISEMLNRSSMENDFNHELLKDKVLWNSTKEEWEKVLTGIMQR